MARFNALTERWAEIYIRLSLGKFKGSNNGYWVLQGGSTAIDYGTLLSQAFLVFDACFLILSVHERDLLFLNEWGKHNLWQLLLFNLIMLLLLWWLDLVWLHCR